MCLSELKVFIWDICIICIIIIMKLLVVFLLVGTMMVLSEGFPEPEPGPEAKPTEGKNSVVKRAAGCPFGWTQFGRRCLIVNAPMKWTDAQNHCLSMKGNLLSIHNVYQNSWAMSLMGGRRTWIAGSDAQEDGQWFNVDGTRFNYANWCHGEPNNHGGQEHCAEINYSDQRCWNDAPCLMHLHSICARKVNP
ncbi:galactose-specific lectin nattectin-like isoform X3 [Sphaeramia orbicularis]|nr:galactose-specific lectin nattectin-like isoform X3 [Sphaeramia orbicularis]